MTGARLSDLGERGFLQRFLPRFASASPRRFRVPPGDDAAVLASPGAPVLTIDGLTEGTHFLERWEAPCRRYGLSWGRALGWKLMSANLSDLAAMGATRDRWALIYLGAPGRLPVSFLSDFYKGLRDVGDPGGCVIAGGDTVRAKDLSLVAAVGGSLNGRPLTRSGAAAGELLCVAGEIGDADAGLNILLGKKSVRRKPDAAAFVRRFFRPPSLLREGAILSAEKGVTAALDLSDSLWESLRILSRLSGVGLIVETAAIPTSQAFDRNFKRTPALLAAGEDYALLFTVKRNRAAALRRRLRFQVIGATTPASSGVVATLDGRSIPAPRDFQHFR